MHQNFHNAAAFLFRDSRRHDIAIDRDRYEDQDSTNNGEEISRDDLTLRASALALLGMHDYQVRWSDEALGLSRGEAQAMSGIKKGEQLGQSLDGGQVAVVGGTGAGVIGQAQILVRHTIKHQEDI